ncbi:penicillin-binding transpeptidase domain-containing protein [Jatrophihabitans fulvus]
MIFGRTGRTVAAALLALGVLAGCTGDDGPPPEQQAVQTFLDAVAQRDAVAAAAVTTDPAAARPLVAATLKGLGGQVRFTDVTTSTKGGITSARFTAEWTLAGNATWRYRGLVPLDDTRDGWRVAWQANTLHPKLRDGEHLQAVRVQPPRAALQDSAGGALFTATPVVTVGIEPRRVTNLGRLATTLAAVPELQSTRADILKAVRAARPTEFVELITLRKNVYERIRSRIYDLPGTVFRSDTRVLAPTAGFGRQLLGSVGEPTAEMIEKSKGRLTAGRQTGLGGLQQALDTQLSGTPGLAVDATSGSGQSTRLATVSAPKPGDPVRLTLERRVQTAAETALASVRQQAAIVVVQPGTGRILADANTSAATYDLGLSAAVPPGSTFKIATWAAAFENTPSLTPATKVACPRTITVDGRRFENEDRFGYPPIPISSAFGYSCNTSAIKAALDLPDGALGAAAKQLGLGGAWTLPVEAFAGSVPTPRTETERAADGIGQGRVLVSPLLMALMAGSAATGDVYAPQLLQTRAPTRTGTVPFALVTKLAPLLRATVALPGGTARDLAGLGITVVGKTGTAEYGDAKPPRSHSWFAGVSGTGANRLAFAVFVYDGASAGTKAVPVARRLLTALG